MKRHIENLQGLLLIEIYKRYSSRSGTSLNAFIKKTLREDDGDLEMTRNIKKDLEELESRDIVIWKAEPMNTKGSGFPKSSEFRNLLGSDKNNTFKNIYVEVTLTWKGLDYAANYSNSQANVSNNLWIRILTTGLLAIALAALIVQMRQCSISDRQPTLTPVQSSSQHPHPSVAEDTSSNTYTLADSTNSFQYNSSKQNDTTHK
ncbi:MAG TPA: hypothetical protein VET23_15840 [Chitinophagaceae bacterium]|nr:hypothetical protein [Chitinophagaceae bacterium]